MSTNVISLYGGGTSRTRQFRVDGTVNATLAAITLLRNGVLIPLTGGYSVSLVAGSGNTIIQIIMPTTAQGGMYEARLPTGLFTYVFVKFQVDAVRSLLASQSADDGGGMG